MRFGQLDFLSKDRMGLQWGNQFMVLNSHLMVLNLTVLNLTVLASKVIHSRQMHIHKDHRMKLALFLDLHHIPHMDRVVI
jgi:hypothetical protein